MNFSYNFAGGGALRADSIDVTGAVTATSFSGDLTGNVNAATVVASTSVSTPTLTTSGTRITVAAGKILKVDNGTIAAPGLEIGTNGVGIFGVSGIAGFVANSSAFGQWSASGIEFLNHAPIFNLGWKAVNQTAPAAPADNSVVVFAVNNAGKDRLSSLFATGAQQPITNEP